MSAVIEVTVILCDKKEKISEESKGDADMVRYIFDGLGKYSLGKDFLGLVYGR